MRTLQTKKEEKEVAMQYTARQMRDLMNMPKPKYSGMLQRKLLFCSHPSNTQGASSKYSKTDAYRNVIMGELISGGFVQRVAHDLAGRANVKLGIVTISTGQHSYVVVDMQAIKKKIKVYNEQLKE